MAKKPNPRLVADAAKLLGVPVSEISDVEDSPAGRIITCADKSRLVVVPDDAPDADGKTGLMFLVAPTEKYMGSFPVYAHPLESDDDSGGDAA